MKGYSDHRGKQKSLFYVHRELSGQDMEIRKELLSALLSKAHIHIMAKPFEYSGTSGCFISLS